MPNKFIRLQKYVDIQKKGAILLPTVRDITPFLHIRQVFVIKLSFFLSERTCNYQEKQTQDPPNKPSYGPSKGVRHHIIDLCKAELKDKLSLLYKAGHKRAGHNTYNWIPELFKGRRQKYPHRNKHNYVFYKKSLPLRGNAP